MTEAGAKKDAQGFWTLNGKRMGGDLYYTNSLNAIVAGHRRAACAERASRSRRTPGRASATSSTRARRRGGCGATAPASTIPSTRCGSITSAGTSRSAGSRSGRRAGRTTISATSSTRSRSSRRRIRKWPTLVKKALTIFLEEQVTVSDRPILSSHPDEHDVLGQLAVHAEPLHPADLLGRHRLPDAARGEEELGASGAAAAAPGKSGVRPVPSALARVASSQITACRAAGPFREGHVTTRRHPPPDRHVRAHRLGREHADLLRAADRAGQSDPGQAAGAAGAGRRSRATSGRWSRSTTPSSASISRSWQQYLVFLKDTARFDLGQSIAYYPSRTIDMIASALPWTIGLLTTTTRARLRARHDRRAR